MLYTTRAKLIASFIGVIFLVGAFSLLIGVRLLNRHVYAEAANRVRLDLNTAQQMYRAQGQQIRIALNITTLGRGFLSSLEARNTPDLIYRLERLARNSELDFAGIVSADGRLLCRLGSNPAVSGMAPLENGLTQLTLEKHQAVEGTVLLSHAFLLDENPELAKRAAINIDPSQKPVSGETPTELRGMAQGAAVPIFVDSALAGILYGGILLNHNSAFVDSVRDAVFQDESYEGRLIGTATVFLDDVRIATNVLNSDGKRAVGTRVSPQVKKEVLDRGSSWTDRTLVVNDWTIAAYQPVVDIRGRRIGMLYVGLLEAKYAAVRAKAIAWFSAITAAGVVLASVLGCLLADRIMEPISQLIRASVQVSRGNLAPGIGPRMGGEIGVLHNTFMEMLNAVRHQQAAMESQVVQSEKQASIGRLAAGVAHEINNPLTGVLTYTHMLLRRKDLDDDTRKDLETIVDATERVRKIVKGLLDFARQTKPKLELTEINRLVQSAVTLLENQALIKRITLKQCLGEPLPVLQLDRSQMQSVLINIMINALDATSAGGEIQVSTAIGARIDNGGSTGVSITIEDNGSGIAPQHLSKLFDPFFTTKAVGQGTGLGLSVSQGIVQRHGGAIYVHSELGKGSRFTIWLPMQLSATTKGEEL